MSYYEIKTVLWRFKPWQAFRQVANDARYRYVTPLERRAMEIEDLKMFLSLCDENAPIIPDNILTQVLYAQA